MAATATDTAHHTTTTATTTDSPAPGVSFQEVLVQPTAPAQGRVDPPALPRGWRHAGLVERLASMSRERRETMYAAGFALVAGVWAPLGIVAFLARSTTLFLVASVAVVVVLSAPRPVLRRASAASPRESLASLGRQLADAITSAGHSARPGLERFGRRVSTGVGHLLDWGEQQGRRVGPALASARDGSKQQWERVSPALARAREAGSRQWQRLRDRLSDLRPEPQSSPRSAR